MAGANMDIGQMLTEKMVQAAKVVEEQLDQEIEKLDRMLGQACQVRESKCPQLRKSRWSKKVHRLRKKRCMLQKWISATRLNHAEHMKQVLHLWRTDNYVSTVLVVALAWYQFHSGMSYPLLQYPNRKAPPSDARWLPRLREYLADIGGSIRLDNPQILPLLRTNDRAIMDVAIQVTQDEDHLRRINHCRLYINAFSIADITNVNGDRLDERYFEGDERIPLIASQVTIYQGKPDPTSWYRWDEFLCRISDRRGKLLQPLGEWLVPGNSIRRRHDHYLETKTDCTYSYESSTGTWLRRTRMPTVTDDLDQRLYGDPGQAERPGK